MHSINQIHAIHSKVWNPCLGSISAEEAFFLQAGIVSDQPTNVIEVGTASGLSTGFLALFMDEQLGGRIDTIDYDTTFWGDRSKSTGYLAKEIYPKQRVHIEFYRNETASSLPDLAKGKSYELAFIDANHQHPWPTLDTICILPFMRPRARVYHHDLALYKHPDHRYGIGPKYLYDQIPRRLRTLIEDDRKNMYYMKTPANYKKLQGVLEDSLRIPWTLMHSIDEALIEKISLLIASSWGKKFSKTFLEIVKNYNKGFLDES